jgi:chromosome segregation ATPase
VRGTRGDELAALYRKIADLQSELADLEARHESVRAGSASADEMVGQMLARVSEVEARLRASQADLDEAEGRAENAEARAGDLASQLGAAQLDVHQLHEDLDEARLEAEAQRAEIEALRTRLSREHEERESLHQRVSEFADVCQERDSALLREELIDAELGEVRGELAEAKRLHAAGDDGGTAKRSAEEARRLQQELQAAHASALRAGEHLRLAVESVSRTLVDLDAEVSLGSAPSSPVLAPLVAATEDDEPTQIFGNLAREIAEDLRHDRS